MDHRFGRPPAFVQVIDIFREASEIADAEVRGLGRVLVERSGFTDVVPAGPHERAAAVCRLGKVAVQRHARIIAPCHLVVVHAAALQGRVVVLVDAPAAQCAGGLAAVAGFAQSVRDAQVVAVVVHAAYVQQRVHGLLEYAIVCSRVVHAHGHRPGGVNRFYRRDQLAAHTGGFLCRVAQFTVAAVDLIAERPHDNGRISDAAPDGRLHHLGIVAGEIPCKVVGLFRPRPAVEQLFYAQHTLVPAQLQKECAAGVVGQPDGVGTHLHHAVDLALHGAAVHFCTNAPKVMVHTHALELGHNSVDGKSRIYVPLCPAVAEHCTAHLGAVHQHCGGVQFWLADVPQRRAVHAHRQAQGVGSGSKAHGLAHLGHICAALADHQLHGFVSCCTKVVQLAGHSGLHRGVVFRLKVREAHHQPVCRKARFLGAQQIYGPVDAAAGVPPGRRLLIAYKNAQVVDAIHQLVGHIEPERVVAVAVLAQLGAIQPDPALHVHAVKVQQGALGAQRLRHFKACPVPCIAAVQITSLVGGRTGRIEAVADAPVVGHGHGLPADIIVAGSCFGGAGVAGVGNIRDLLESPCAVLTCKSFVQRCGLPENASAQTVRHGQFFTVQGKGICQCAAGLVKNTHAVPP